ncbi:MAG: heme-copper oxidase subunit III [Actinobacteria bacterium]|nr:heme-copper oxidase subunit III [Actinomycetota bacterium]MCB9388471.1 heme-copper oxidase subunit III [Acidimicrobiia bacterium]
MWAFLASECFFFGSLITTYFAFRGQSTSGPIPEDVFDIGFTSLSSFVLLMSSLTMVLAVSAAKRGDMSRTKAWLAATAAFGAVFIGGQIYEFTTFIAENLHIQTNLFGSSFFLLTGFHGAHVTVGILMLLTTIMIINTGYLTAEDSESIETIGLYWHFVDVVWIVIFTVVYLIPQ